MRLSLKATQTKPIDFCAPCYKSYVLTIDSDAEALAMIVDFGIYAKDIDTTKPEGEAHTSYEGHQMKCQMCGALLTKADD